MFITIRAYKVVVPILIIQPRYIKQTGIPLTHYHFTQSMVSIVLAVLEMRSLKMVDGRTMNYERLRYLHVRVWNFDMQNEKLTTNSVEKYQF